MAYHNYKELLAWKKAKELCIFIYHFFNECENENSVFYKQMIRAALSIPSNIAEGCGRGTNKQTLHFLDIAYGSTCELETQMIIYSEIKSVNQEHLDIIFRQIIEVQKLIFGFKHKISLGENSQISNLKSQISNLALWKHTSSKHTAPQSAKQRKEDSGFTGPMIWLLRS